MAGGVVEHILQVKDQATKPLRDAASAAKDLSTAADAASQDVADVGAQAAAINDLGPVLARIAAALEELGAASRQAGAATAAMAQDARTAGDQAGAAIRSAGQDAKATAGFMDTLGDAIKDIVPPAALSDLQKLEQLAAQATTAFKKGEITAEQYAAALKQIDAAADKAKAASGGLGDAADAAGGKIGKMAGGLGVISPAAGAAAATVADLLDVVTVLASPMGIVAGVAGASALAVAGLTTALVASVFAADEALASLEGFKLLGSDFYPSVPASTIASIEAVNASTDALASVWQRATVVLASEAAPAVERVASTIVGLALEASDLFDAFAAGTDVVHELAVTLASGLASALLGPINGLQLLAQGFLALADATGITVSDGTRAAIQSFVDLDRTLAEGLVSTAGAALEASGLGETLDGAADRGRAFISVQQSATAALDGKSAAIQRQKDALALLQQVEEIAARGLSGEEQEARAAAMAMDALRAKAAELGLTVEQIQPALDQLQRELSDKQGARAFQEGLAEAASWAESEFAPRVDEAAQALGSFRAQMGQLVPAETMDALTRLALLQTDLTLAFSEGRISAEQYAAALEEVSTAKVDATRQQALGTAQAATGAAGSLGGLAALDPSGISSAVVAGMQTVADLGAGGGVIGEAQELLKGFAEGLPSLGPVISDFVSNLLTEAIPGILGSLDELLRGLVEAVPEMIAALVDAIPAVVDALVEAVPDVVLALVEAVPDVVLALVEAVPELVGSLVSAGPELIEALMEGLPEIIAALVASAPEIVLALVQMIPDLLLSLLKGLGDAFLSLFGPIGGGLEKLGEGVVRAAGEVSAFLKDAPERIADGWEKVKTGIGDWSRAVVEWVKGALDFGTGKGEFFGEGGAVDKAGKDTKDWFQSAGQTIRGWFEEGFVGGKQGFATGTDFVPRTGLALVHQGERIIPATGAGSGRSSLLNSSSGPVVNINSIWPPSPSQVNDIVREINRHLGSSGRGLAWGG